MFVSVGPAFAGYDASQMAIVTSCETTITSIVHDVNDNHAKLGKDIASGVAAHLTSIIPCKSRAHTYRHMEREVVLRAQQSCQIAHGQLNSLT